MLNAQDRGSDPRHPHKNPGLATGTEGMGTGESLGFIGQPELMSCRFSDRPQKVKVERDRGRHGIRTSGLPQACTHVYTPALLSVCAIHINMQYIAHDIS